MVDPWGSPIALKTLGDTKELQAHQSRLNACARKKALQSTPEGGGTWKPKDSPSGQGLIAKGGAGGEYALNSGCSPHPTS